MIRSARRWLMPALAAPLLLLAACGGAKEELSFPDREVREPDLSRAGRITGTMRWTGEVPEPRRIRMTSDCPHHPDGAPTETYVISEGGLENVFIHLKSGLEDWVFPIPREPVVIDQVGCVYVPHVVGVQRWQPVEFRNSDDTGHNINTSGARRNDPFNFSQAAKGPPRQKQFANEEFMLEARCNIHGWMACMINVVDHPYFTVSAKGGAFSLGKVPPGSYVIEAIHERLGRQERRIEVPPEGAVEVDFDWKK